MIAVAPDLSRWPEVRAGSRAGVVDLHDLYLSQRQALVRLAWLLVDDLGDAEDVVHQAFVQAHLAWGRLRGPDRALAYLRRAVLHGARSRPRRLRALAHQVPAPSGGTGPAEPVAVGEDHVRALAAVRSLPLRQRECLVLRFYFDLSAAEMADALGISAGAVETHVHRGLEALAGCQEADR